jgi:hypothetical protein
MVSDAPASEPSLELEEELSREIERMMLVALWELEPRRRRPEILTRIEVSSLAEAAAKGLLEAGWRLG